MEEILLLSLDKGILEELCGIELLQQRKAHRLLISLEETKWFS